MGLFGRKKKDDVKTRVRSRPRVDEAPPGWVTVQALVDSHKQEKTWERVKLSGLNEQPVFETVTTYSLLDEQDTPFEIFVEARLRSGDLPKQGERLTVAYDPQEPSSYAIIESETDLLKRNRAHVRSAVREGVEAPCEVLSATPTGRVSRSTELSPAPETRLVLRVTPPGEEELQVSCTQWDRDIGLAPGVRGVLLYRAGEPAKGYPVFPNAGHRAMGGDPVQHARDEIVGYWMDPYWDT